MRKYFLLFIAFFLIFPIFVFGKTKCINYICKKDKNFKVEIISPTAGYLKSKHLKIIINIISKNAGYINSIRMKKIKMIL